MEWSEWSRSAVQMMKQRNEDFMNKYDLQGKAYSWDLNEALLEFTSPGEGVKADLCVVGAYSETEGNFVWAWQSETIPEKAREKLKVVRLFGEDNNFELLNTPIISGDLHDSLELAAASARILDSEGIWVSREGDTVLFFLLSNFRKEDDLN